MQLDLDRLGDQLRVLRELRGLSQHELARAAGIAQGSVSLIENGGRVPSLPMLIRISYVLDLSIDINPRELSPDGATRGTGATPAQSPSQSETAT